MWNILTIDGKPITYRIKNNRLYVRSLGANDPTVFDIPEIFTDVDPDLVMDVPLAVALIDYHEELIRHL